MSFDANKKFKKLLEEWVEKVPITSGDYVVDANEMRGRFRWWCYSQFPNSYIVSQKLFTEALKVHLPHRRASNGTQFFLSKDTINQLKLKEKENEVQEL